MKHRLLLVFACAALSVSGWALWVSACDHAKRTSTRTALHTAAKTTVANNDGCAAHGAKSTSAVTASTSGCSPGSSKGASFVTAGFAGPASACVSKNAMDNSSISCAVHAMPTADARSHECDACKDMASCQERLRSSNANMQIVPLKNGVMYVYTAESPANVRSIQSALARRTERLMAISNAGDKAKLCTECRAVRGALASGKLTRETVNVEGGCLTLMTSSDPSMVAKLHAMTGVTTAQRIKS